MGKSFFYLTILVLSLAISNPAFSKSQYELTNEVKSLFNTGEFKKAGELLSQISDTNTKQYWIGKLVKVHFDTKDLESAKAYTELLIDDSTKQYWYGKFTKHYFDTRNLALAEFQNEQITDENTKQYWYGKFIKFYFDTGELTRVPEWFNLLEDESTKQYWYSKLVKHYFDKGDVENSIKYYSFLSDQNSAQYWITKYVKFFIGSNEKGKATEFLMLVKDENNKRYLASKVEQLASTEGSTQDSTRLQVEELLEMQSKQVENFATLSESAPALTGALSGLLTIVKDAEQERRQADDQAYEKALAQKKHLDQLTNEVIALIEENKNTVATIKAKAIAWIDTGNQTVDEANRDIYNDIRAELTGLAAQ